MQIAKAFGAELTGACSTRNLDLVRSIGAAQVIDYTQEDFSQTGQRYDLVFDVVAKRSFSDCRRALKPQGICHNCIFAASCARRTVAFCDREPENGTIAPQATT